MRRWVSLDMCRFCYRPARMTLTRHRRTILERVLGRPRRSVRVCSDHKARAIEYVR